MLGWYCVLTKVAKEATASVSVASKGFDVFFPVRPVIISHAGRRMTKDRCLFPRYIFVSNDHPGIECGEINYARGVANKGLLCAANSLIPYVVSNRIIDDIRRREEVARMKAGELRTGYLPGQTFTMKLGTWANLELTYFGEERGKVIASVHLFGSARMIELDVEELPPVRVIDNYAA